MSLAIGIVGLPNVGKSTLFKALTKKQIDIANYPFCTIEPNVGVVEVPDERLAALATTSQSAKVVPAVVEFVDIAGLVAGASTGEGLGNKFLAHIREVDAIAQVVRVFADPNTIHVSGAVNPTSDLATINTELALADLDTVSRRLNELERKLKSGRDAETVLAVEVFTKIKAVLDAGSAARSVPLTDDERVVLKTVNLLTAKPMLYVVNVDEADAAATTWDLPGVEPGAVVVPISAKIEAELAELAPEEQRAYLAELGAKERGLDRLIVAGYALLDLITFLTSGPQESRAWTVRRGATAPQAAGRIHTDFEKGFIRAEVCRWQDFVAYGEAGCRERGLLRTEGKDYIVNDGDVMHFRFSA